MLKSLGDFEIDLSNPIGSGGSGTVFKGVQKSLNNRTVAIKVLNRNISGTYTDEDISRFKREIEVLSQLSGSNIVHIYGAGIEAKDGLVWYAMEYVASPTLEEVIKNKELSIPDILKISLNTANALNSANKFGIIHRDIKPSNIFVADDFSVKLADFGLAKRPGTQTLTSSDTVIGTLDYIAPERIEGKGEDFKSDIYALGAIMYEMIAKSPPFGNNLSTPEILYKHVSEKPPKLSVATPSINRDLEQLIHQCLEKKPEKRPQNYQIIVSMLEKILNESKGVTQPAGLKNKLFYSCSAVLIAIITYAISIKLSYDPEKLSVQEVLGESSAEENTGTETEMDPEQDSTILEIKDNDPMEKIAKNTVNIHTLTSVEPAKSHNKFNDLLINSLFKQFSNITILLEQVIADPQLMLQLITTNIVSDYKAIFNKMSSASRKPTSLQKNDSLNNSTAPAENTIELIKRVEFQADYAGIKGKPFVTIYLPKGIYNLNSGLIETIDLADTTVKDFGDYTVFFKTELQSNKQMHYGNEPVEQYLPMVNGVTPYMSVSDINGVNLLALHTNTNSNHSIKTFLDVLSGELTVAKVFKISGLSKTDSAYFSINNTKINFPLGIKNLALRIKLVPTPQEPGKKAELHISNVIEYAEFLKKCRYQYEPKFFKIDDQVNISFPLLVEFKNDNYIIIDGQAGNSIGRGKVSVTIE